MAFADFVLFMLALIVMPVLAIALPMAAFELLRWSLAWCWFAVFGGDRPKWQPILGDGGEHFTGGI